MQRAPAAGAGGSGRVVVEMASLQRLDAPLAEAMSELARELGYGQLISSA